MNTPTNESNAVSASASTLASIEAFQGPRLEKLRSSRTAFEENYAKHTNLVQQITAHEKAAQAAETEAQDAKAKLRDALRECAGRPSKKLHDLKAQQRAAYALAEEYRSLIQDISLERDRLEIKLHESARDFNMEIAAARYALVDFLLDKAFATMPAELLAGMHLMADVQNYDRYSEWHQTPYDELSPDIESFVINKVDGRLRTLFRQDDDSLKDLLPSEFRTPLPVGGYGLSPMRLRKLKDDLEARERAAASE